MSEPLLRSSEQDKAVELLVECCGRDGDGKNGARIVAA